MNLPELTATIEIPKGVTVTEKVGEFTAKGPKGEVTRRLFHPRITVSVQNGEIILRSTDVTKREKKMLYTFNSHLKNLVRGVTEGHVYKLKVCSGHFPMAVTVKGDMLEVKNFIGEAVPRTVKINPHTKVVIDGVIITVEGNEIEATSQMASLIEQLCKRSGFDRRIFQDGIYITHKDDQPIQ